MPTVPGFTDNLPKYQQLATAWRKQIATGVLKPDDRLPSFARLREEFGATQATVEKAFTILEQEGLIVRAASRGVYVAARKTKKARQQQSGLVGVTGPGFSLEGYSVYWMEVLRGVRSVADKAEMQIVLLDHASHTGWEKTDGVLVCDWTAHDILDRAASSQPCVSVLMNATHRASVYADDYGGGYQAAEYLLKLGHRRIAFLQNSDTSIVARRLAGYQDALAAAGITPDGRWLRFIEGFSRNKAEFVARGREDMAAWLRGSWKQLGCTALLAQNDAFALGATQSLMEVGLSVPGDVSVMGYDGTDICCQSIPHLSSVEVPLFEIGARSMELLERQIKADEVSNEHEVLAVKVVERDSTAPPRNRQ